MTTHVLHTVEAERARGFSGLAGSRADAHVPVRQALVDAIVARVPRWPAPVEGLQVRIGADNRIQVSAAVRVLGFRTRVRLPLRLAPQMEGGRVRLVIEGRSIVANALSWLGPMLGQLPGGILLQGQQIVVDVPELAQKLGAADLAALLHSASFRSEDGVLWIDAGAAVPDTTRQAPGDGDEDGPAGDPAAVVAPGTERAGRPESPRRELPFTVDELATWLAGARVEADVRLSERFANDLAAALHHDARVTAAANGGAADVLARSVRRPVLRFEDGALRLSGGLDVPE